MDSIKTLCAAVALAAASVSPFALADNDSRLLLARQDGSQCLIEVWDARSNSVNSVARLDTCPRRIFAIQNGTEIAFAYEGEIFSKVLGGTDLALPQTKLPSLSYDDYKTLLTVFPTDEYLAKAHSQEMQVEAIGIHERGAIGIHLKLGMAADDSYDYLFVHERGEWKLLDQKWCHRFDACLFETLTYISTHIWSTPDDPRNVWHDAAKQNPYFVDEQKESEWVDDYLVTDVKREFRIEDTNVRLSYSTLPGPDTGATLTSTIRLKIDNKPVITLADGQCLAYLSGRHLLVAQFWGGTLEVMRLDTGESVFGPLRHAKWLN
ncbi:MAG: hypothetical protein GKR90_25885 [Pseudomonadales bacterium]|nr:hypothetical protein [Pseudomonadales bacterium]